MARRTKAKDLRRKSAFREERRTIVLFCEGERSEPDYLEGLRRLPEIHDSTAVNIEIAPGHGVPLTLVSAAVDAVHDGEIDECWCVFDVEWPQHHPNLDEALALAARHGIRVAVSNPCFELWLILHLQEQTAFLTTDEAERLSKRVDGRAGKAIAAARYLPHRRAAVARARALARRHAGDGTRFPDDNPSSGMADLLDAIEPGAGRQAPRRPSA